MTEMRMCLCAKCLQRKVFRWVQIVIIIICFMHKVIGRKPHKFPIAILVETNRNALDVADGDDDGGGGKSIVINGKQSATHHRHRILGGLLIR